MSNNKGITLVSVIIYLIVLGIVIGVISGITQYFYKNSKDVVVNDDTSVQYSRLMDYLIEDINSGNVDNVSITNEGSNIFMNLFLADQTTHQYQYDSSNKRIVYVMMDLSGNANKKITICNRVSECRIQKSDSDNKINIKTTINDVVYENDFYY